MIYPAGSTLSALHAFGRKMNVTANNVANVQTDKFKKSRVTFSEGEHGGPTTVIDKVETPGAPKETIDNGKVVETESSNVDLAEELPEMMTAKSGYKANLKALHAKDDMLGSLLDIVS